MSGPHGPRTPETEIGYRVFPVWLSPQQGDRGPPQEQLSMSLPRRAAWIIAQAHPTPLYTSIACVGQFRAHAPHSMHCDGRPSCACFSPSAKTAWGQTWVQRLQLMHRSGWYTRVFSR